MNANELLIELRKFVLIKSGLRNIDPSHCKVISEYVFKETKNYVSETTIKRFFGFANTLHKFSLFTLNSLSQYIGFADWDSFCKDKETQVISASSVWQDLRLKTHAITDVSLIAKKNNSGVPFNATANRSFFYPDFDYFLRNDYQFTTISTQPGNGKSILIAHMVEHFFYSENAVYKNDIVLLINATVLNSMIQNGLTLKDWFLKEFKFGSLSELISFFKKNPEQREGRFVVIIDGIDEILNKTSYFNTFIDFLYGIEESSFIKIVLGLRTITWSNMQPVINGSAFLANAWYKGLFYDSDSLSNVPSLNTEEILHTLTVIEGKTICVEDISPELLAQFKSPFWLQVYFKIKDEYESLELSNPLLCYELIHYFLQKKIFQSKKSTEKISILKKISNLILERNKDFRIDKEEILDTINTYGSTYDDLVLNGIIVEEKTINTSIPKEYVRFLNTDIYAYFLFVQITEKFDYQPCEDFFLYILRKLEDDKTLRDTILNWSIRYCINKNEVAALKHIFKLSFSNEEKNKSFDFICSVSKYELNRSGSSFNKQSINMDFIDIMAGGRTMSGLYKETIRTISDHVLNEDIQIMLHIIEANIYLVDIDKIALANVMQNLKRSYKRLGELFPINPYDLLLYFYNNLTNKPTESKVLDDKIIKLCHDIDRSRPLRNDELSSHEVLCYRMVLQTLFSKKNYAECHRFIMAVLNKYPNIFFIRHSVFSPFLLMHLAQTYLKLNYLKKALRIIQFLEKIIKSDYTYHTRFVLAGLSLLKANFFNYTQNYGETLREVEAGLRICRDGNFKSLEITLTLIKIEALKASETSEEVSTSIKDLLSFLSTNKISMPDYANLSGLEFEHTFKILKSYRRPA
ncbi:hypothetical protein ACJVDH_01765 [Pedobacter sp. AW1-32]|uniref:hypothetical protein n=1 Tax=Pedobacter sp. AW1-32 TaxID=3383026 RepID=UPI003FF0FBC4